MARRAVRDGRGAAMSAARARAGAFPRTPREGVGAPPRNPRIPSYAPDGRPAASPQLRLRPSPPKRVHLRSGLSLLCLFSSFVSPCSGLRAAPRSAWVRVPYGVNESCTVYRFATAIPRSSRSRLAPTLRWGSPLAAGGFHGGKPIASGARRRAMRLTEPLAAARGIKGVRR